MIKRIANKFVNSRLLDESKIINREQMADGFHSVFFSGEEKSILKPELYHFNGFNTPFFLSDFGIEQVFKAPFYSIIENAFLCGGYATALSEEGKVLIETTYGSKGYLKKGGDAKIIWGYKFVSTEKVVELAFSLVNIFSKSYFHWVAEVLPTLEAYFEFKSSTSLTPKLIVDYPLSSFQLEYLKLLNIGEEDLIFWKYKKVKVKNLIVPSLRFNRIEIDDFWAYHLYSKKGFDWLRKSLLTNVSVNNFDGVDKILIDRSDALGRRVINQKEVEASLKEYEFKSIATTQLSVHDQVKLFAGLKKVVGPHGAGLVNTIFSDNLFVFELFPSNRSIVYAYYFYEISSYYSHQHNLISAEGVNEVEDMCVKINQLEELINHR